MTNLEMTKLCAEATSSEQAIMEAVARGWCDPANSHKEMDTILAASIVREVVRVLKIDALAEAANDLAGAYWWLEWHGYIATNNADDSDSDAQAAHWRDIAVRAMTRIRVLMLERCEPR